MKNAVLVVTVSGEDRAGLVSELSETVAKVKGNWERSRMLNLSGRFVGLLEIHVSEEHVQELEDRLAGMKDLEMTMARGKGADKPGRSFELEVMGTDAPGIVHDVFSVLAERGVNVELLSTRTEAAADSGTTLFRAQARLAPLDPGVEIESLQASLEAIAPDLMVRIHSAEE